MNKCVVVKLAVHVLQEIVCSEWGSCRVKFNHHRPKLVSILTCGLGTAKLTDLSTVPSANLTSRLTEPTPTELMVHVIDLGPMLPNMVLPNGKIFLPMK